MTHWFSVKLGWEGSKTGELGPRKGTLLRKYRSGVTGDSHPGIKVLDLPPGQDQHPIVQGNLGNRRTSPSWGKYSSDGSWDIDISLDLSPVGLRLILG